MLLHNNNLERQRPLFLEDSFKIFIYLTAPGLSCGTRNMVPWPGIEPRHPMLGARSLKHRTTREALRLVLWWETWAQRLPVCSNTAHKWKKNWGLNSCSLTAEPVSFIFPLSLTFSSFAFQIYNDVIKLHDRMKNTFQTAHTLLFFPSRFGSDF